MHIAHAAALIAALLVAQPVAAETVTFTAPTFPEPVFRTMLQNQPSGEATIKGELRLPDTVTGPVPAVIVAHTSGGVLSADRDVMVAANKAGFAALSYDSYGPRGIADVKVSGGPGAVVHQAFDALIAVKRLAADPRIDAKRIAIVGLSAGGGAAIFATTNLLHNRVLGEGGPRPAAMVAFYPGIHAAPAAAAYTTVPMLVIVGDKDDFQAPSRTKRWVDYIQRETGGKAPIVFELVPGARHSFLESSLPWQRWDDKVGNPSGCPTVLFAPGQPPSYLLVDGSVRQVQSPEEGRALSQACTTSGASLGYHHEAADAALKRTIAFLKEAFAAVP